MKVDISLYIETKPNYQMTSIKKLYTSITYLKGEMREKGRNAKKDFLKYMYIFACVCVGASFLRLYIYD